jgi:diacylglycerol kinase family enzyme
MPAYGSAVCLILNRRSGLHEQSLNGLTAALERHGLQIETVVVDRKSDPRQAARDALSRGAKILVAAGGDGTIGAIASVAVDSDAVLGVIPAGTLNHFARDLGIPLNFDDAAAVIATGTVAAIDVGEVNGHIFINNSGIGVYPQMVAWRQRYQRKGWSKLRALLGAAVTALRRMPFLKLRLRAQDADRTIVTPMIFIGNNEYEVEGFRAGGRMRFDEGRLFLYAANAATPWRLLRLSLLALFGRVRQDRDFCSLCGDEAWIETRRKTLKVSLDGEVVRIETPLHYRIRPAALRVIVPYKEIPFEPSSTFPMSTSAAQKP